MKIPSRYQHEDKVDNIWLTCVCLHNELVRYNGMDTAWEKNIDWAQADGLFDDDQAGGHEAMLLTARSAVSAGYDRSWNGAAAADDVESVIQVEASHKVLQDKLVTH